MPIDVVSPLWLANPAESGSVAGFGIYLHVPFCQHRCGYCDFATSDRHAHLHAPYARALTAQIRAWAAAAPADIEVSDAALKTWPDVTSVFVGGGTPTQLGVDAEAGLDAVVRSVCDAFALAPGAEVTVECNPEDASDELFCALADAGVTRVSIGMQAGTTRLLTLLERPHDPEAPVRAAAMARRAGIEHTSLDLIYGTPSETEEELDTALALVVEADVDHVSAYALSIHENTAFGRLRKEGTLAPTNDDLQRSRWEQVRGRLAASGFEQYELSNWARGPAARSAHNTLYWRHGDYLGLGVGAHAHWRGRRWWNTRSIDGWLEEASAGGLTAGQAGSETLTEDEQALERLMLGLRLREGIVAHDLPPLQSGAVEQLRRSGHIAPDDERLRLTEDGWFLIDEVVRQILA